MSAIRAPGARSTLSHLGHHGEGRCQRGFEPGPVQGGLGVAGIVSESAQLTPPPLRYAASSSSSWQADRREHLRQRTVIVQAVAVGQRLRRSWRQGDRRCSRCPAPSSRTMRLP